MRWIAISILFISMKTSAGTLLEVGGTYFSESMSSSSSTSSSKYFYNLGLLFSLQNRLWGGWNYSGINHTDANTTTDTYTSQDTGPYMKWQFGRASMYSLSAAYNILSRGTFSSGSTNENWQGTSIWFQFGVLPEIKAGFHMGLSLNYYLASYTTKTVSSTESTVSYSKSWIFPMLTVTKEW